MMENLDKLIHELCSYPRETQWIELKHDNYNPDMIGQDISALANGATLEEKRYAYFLWGIEDKTHRVVGTDHTLTSLKVGAQELENWLRSMLSNNADFEYDTTQIDGLTVGVLMIHCTQNQPVTFKKTGYIRVGSYTKKLSDHPALEARLWNRLQNLDFEGQLAKSELTLSDALRLIDYGVYFDLLNITTPASAEGIAHYMLEEEIILKQDNGLYGVTNMGARHRNRRTRFSPSGPAASRVLCCGSFRGRWCCSIPRFP